MRINKVFKMSFVLKNLQNIVKLNIFQIDKDIRILRRLMEIENYDLSCLLVTDEYITQLNKVYRHIDAPTDVLAFPFLQVSVPGVLPKILDTVEHEGEQMLGDLCLAPNYILQQCQEYKDIFNDVLMATVTHGLCHLVGHDHESQEQWQLMVTAEKDILSKFNKLTGYACKPLVAVGH